MEQLTTSPPKQLHGLTLLFPTQTTVVWQPWGSLTQQNTTERPISYWDSHFTAASYWSEDKPVAFSQLPEQSVLLQVLLNGRCQASWAHMENLFSLGCWVGKERSGSEWVHPYQLWKALGVHGQVLLIQLKSQYIRVLLELRPHTKAGSQQLPEAQIKSLNQPW